MHRAKQRCYGTATCFHHLSSGLVKQNTLVKMWLYGKIIFLCVCKNREREKFCNPKVFVQNVCSIAFRSKVQSANGLGKVVSYIESSLKTSTSISMEKQ